MSHLGHFSTAYDVVSGVTLQGKNAVVTGGYTGIGLHTTAALASVGAHVIVLARDVRRARHNLRNIANVDIEYVDLLLPDTIDAVAERILGRGAPIHLLINSAGIMGIPLTRDKRGYEYMFATNHLGHFQLTARLFPALTKAQGARVVAVSSRGHRAGGVQFEDIHWEHTKYEPMRAYAQSKSANALFAVRLDQLAQKHDVRAFAVHPGPIPSSDLFAESRVGIRSPFEVEVRRLAARAMRGLHITELYNAILRPTTPNAFKTIQQGAATSVWCATSPDLDAMGGVFCEDCHLAPKVSADSDAPYGVRPWAIDPDQAARLWTVSEKLTGVTFDTG